MIIHQDYKCRVSASFFGGCGNNVLREVVSGIDPDDYPDFLLLGVNTDAKAQQGHFGNKEDEHIRRWEQANALTTLTLDGGVTGGRGAGADAKLGRQAAESPETIEKLKDFYEKSDEHILVGGLGGGTGTGFLPVAARLAKATGKTTLAVVVMPDPDEGRDQRAVEALQEIQSLVPTIAIRNSYIVDYIQSLDESERDVFPFREAWRVVNEHSIVPILRIIREFIQVVGNMKNFDQNDWRTTLSHGNHVFFGLARHDPGRLREIDPEKIVDELLMARFQDPGLITRGRVLAMWGHGPWPYLRFKQIRDLAKARICENDQARMQQTEAHWGVVDDVADGEMWISLVVVADSVRDAEAPSAPMIIESVNNQLERVERSTPALLHSVKPRREEIKFLCRGLMRTVSLESRDAAKARRVLSDDPTVTWEEFLEVSDKIENIFNMRPDPPVGLQRVKASGS